MIHPCTERWVESFKERQGRVIFEMPFGIVCFFRNPLKTCFKCLLQRGNIFLEIGNQFFMAVSSISPTNASKSNAALIFHDGLIYFVQSSTCGVSLSSLPLAE